MCSRKVEAEARRIGANASVVVAAYRTLIEASILHELEQFDRQLTR